MVKPKTQEQLQAETDSHVTGLPNHEREIRQARKIPSNVLVNRVISPRNGVERDAASIVISERVAPSEKEGE